MLGNGLSIGAVARRPAAAPPGFVLDQSPEAGKPDSLWFHCQCSRRGSRSRNNASAELVFPISQKRVASRGPRRLSTERDSCSATSIRGPTRGQREPSSTSRRSRERLCHAAPGHMSGLPSPSRLMRHPPAAYRGWLALTHAQSGTSWAMRACRWDRLSHVKTPGLQARSSTQRPLAGSRGYLWLACRRHRGRRSGVQGSVARRAR